MSIVKLTEIQFFLIMRDTDENHITMTSRTPPDSIVYASSWIQRNELVCIHNDSHITVRSAYKWADIMYGCKRAK